MRVAAAVLGLTLFGWALVVSADARHEGSEGEVRYRLVEVQPDPVEDVPTPFADGLVDWVQVEADTDCLWELLQREQVDITFENVWAAGVWTDALGGACRVIGEDDE